MTATDLIRGLPGEALVREGLNDVESGRVTVPACVVEIARTRFQRAGLLPAATPATISEPELQLYRLLRKGEGDAYSRYNALVRELVSFEQALDRRLRQSREEYPPAVQPIPGALNDSPAAQAEDRGAGKAG